MKLIQTELKKIFSIKRILLLSFVVSCCCLALFSMYYSNKRKNIDLFIRNKYTSGVGNVGLNDEKEIEKLKTDEKLLEVLNENEIEETYYLWKNLFISQVEAVDQMDFEEYNRLDYEIVSNEKVNKLPRYGYGKKEIWIIRDTEECKGKAVCLSEGFYQLPIKEQNKYNLENHVYPPQALQASDFLYKLESEIYVFLVPLIGIYVCYLFLNQEKKEQSDKLTWTFPYPKFQIFLSKVISSFIVASVIVLFSTFLTYLIVGCMSGFQSGQRLLSIKYSRLFLGEPSSIADEFIVIKQWQLNLILFAYNLFSLFISIFVTQFVSIFVKNKKTMVLIAIFIVGAFPYLLSEYLQNKMLRKWYFILYPFFSLYLPIMGFLQKEIIQRDIYELSVYELRAIHLMDTNYLELYLKNMSLTQGLIVGTITIGVMMILVKILLKRKDMI